MQPLMQSIAKWTVEVAVENDAMGNTGMRHREHRRKRKAETLSGFGLSQGRRSRSHPPT
jgi:hypothetical protein